jgi:hypothetical protein
LLVPRRKEQATLELVKSWRAECRIGLRSLDQRPSYGKGVGATFRESEDPVLSGKPSGENPPPPVFGLWLAAMAVVVLMGAYLILWPLLSGPI